MKSCVIFGGAGFIGTHLAKHFITSGRFDHIHIADIRNSPLEGSTGITYSKTDVRQPITKSLIEEKPEWVFNLAAIHREPGHEAREYFDTNIAGARNVSAYTEQVSCHNIYFTSSIAVYGPTGGPTSEQSPTYPSTPYGSSKLPAEMIHESWQRSGVDRRLITARPGVVYGPGDPGNIMRMIKAIRRGYFAYPGKPSIYKSYAYIYGLIDSINYTMNRKDSQITYNYVETPTQPLSKLVETIKKRFNCRALVAPLPLWLLLPIANLIQLKYGMNNPIHPVRVKKAATSTHIIPKWLIDNSFEFKYDFMKSLEHWERISPVDFDLKSSNQNNTRKLHLVRPKENKESLEPLLKDNNVEPEHTKSTEKSLNS